ncbi:MAG TPA: alanine racemase [Candidatus Eisenbacteria bacterium]|nr:alanine racemase [Candidatus Eisenbacteria bacterium]
MTAQKKSANVKGRPVWAEISLSALTHNLQAIRNFVNPKSEPGKSPRKILCIVKGNGYGHGGPQVAKHLEKAGADWFGVTGAAEGEAVRKAGVRKPILALTSFWPGEEDQLLKNKIAPAIIRCEQLAALESAAARRKLAQRSVGIHLKIDTGMNRLGIAPTDIDCFARQYEKSRRLKLQGVFTHFASSEVFQGPVASQTCEQEESFHRAVERLRVLGIDPGLIHLANSAAIASRPETWADMVRPGAILYGYHPGYDPIERRTEAEKQLPLRPVMSLRTRIINIRQVHAGDGVGYNAKFLPQRSSKIAVLAAGYGDGIHRSLGNQGNVLVNGVLAPIVGIISMDVTMADVTDVPNVALGDIATIYGSDGDQVLAANLVARSIGTVTSDLLCAVSARVPRIYAP